MEGSTMRKTIFLLFSFLFVTSLCFAQQAQTRVSQSAVSQAASAPVATKILTAKVDLVTIGDTAKGTQSELMVVTDDGQKLSFAVKNGTPITGKNAKTITLSDVKKEDKVVVEYVTKATGTKKAVSIKLIE